MLLSALQVVTQATGYNADAPSELRVAAVDPLIAPFPNFIAKSIRSFSCCFSFRSLSKSFSVFGTTGEVGGGDAESGPGDMNRLSEERLTLLRLNPPLGAADIDGEAGEAEVGDICGREVKYSSRREKKAC